MSEREREKDRKRERGERERPCAHVCLSVYLCASTGESVCLCVRERERERENDTCALVHIFSLQALHPAVGEARCDPMLPSILVFFAGLMFGTYPGAHGSARPRPLVQHAREQHVDFRERDERDERNLVHSCNIKQKHCQKGDFPSFFSLSFASSILIVSVQLLFCFCCCFCFCCGADFKCFQTV